MFFVFGGVDESQSVTKSAEIFDPNLGSWRAGADLPRWMRLNCATNIDNRVLIFGWYYEHIYIYIYMYLQVLMEKCPESMTVSWNMTSLSNPTKR